MDLIQIAKELSAASFATFLIVVLITGYKRVWVWGYHLEAAIKERDALIEYERSQKEEWKSLVWETRKLTEKSVSLASKAVAQQ